MKKMIAGAFAMALGLSAALCVPSAYAADGQYVVAGVGKDRTPWCNRHEEGVMQGAKENGMEGIYAAAPPLMKRSRYASLRIISPRASMRC